MPPPPTAWSSWIKSRNAPASRSQAGTARRPARRTDLDWLRVAAFGLLIFYHMGMFFGPWEWHINAANPSQWVGGAMTLSNPWRLSLLFFISGCATRFMADRRGARAVLRNRGARLLLPFLFGLLVLVPPQIFVERTVKEGLGDPYWRFWIGRLLRPQDLCLVPGCPPVQTNHLWFLAYALLYTVPAVILAMATGLRRRVELVLIRVLRRTGPLLVPAVYLVAARLLLFPRFGATNHPFSDPYGHASYFAVFLMGFLLARRGWFWRAVERDRWFALLIAVNCGFFLSVNAMTPFPRQIVHTSWPVMSAFGVDQWAAVVAALGFASRHLRTAGGPMLAYLRGAILPFYLLHQTIMVVAAFVLRDAGLSAWAEAGAILAVTVVGCVVGFELARRVPPLGLFLGAGPAPAASRPPRLATPRMADGASAAE